MSIPELLSPAGNWDSLKAAVANGADAVYFGVDAFNARQRADNFRIGELPELMRWLHDRDVRGFLTFNVLVFSDELERAAELLLAADRAGVDAVIVQDVGLCRLARELVPHLVLHGSTQMSITSAAGVAQAAALGCERVVMARELALTDLERLQGQLKQRHLAMPLEVFVHGALCVAYSGQCLTSESLGQRSANRGECAQACRLPYELVVDGEAHDLEEQRYLLSPQDLSAWTLLPELQRIGVASLKIEGRLKDPSYVAAVTEAYRRGSIKVAIPTLKPMPTPTQERGVSWSWPFPAVCPAAGWRVSTTAAWFTAVGARNVVRWWVNCCAVTGPAGCRSAAAKPCGRGRVLCSRWSRRIRCSHPARSAGGSWRWSGWAGSG